MERTIMTVDDSKSIRQMVSFTLQRENYQMVEARDGKEALAKLTPNVSLMLADLYMPEMDGIELIRAVRDIPDFRFLPIVMLTTETEVAKKQEGKAAGATGWIAKPFEPDQLIAVVKKILG